MEQQQFNLIEQPSEYRVCLTKDGSPLLRLRPDSFAGAQERRRSLVKALQNNPRHRVRWEDVPRPSGWYGLLRGNDEAHVYVASIVPV